MSSNSKQKTYEQILYANQIASPKDIPQPLLDKHLDISSNYQVIFPYT